MDSDEGIRIQSKSTSKKIFINKNLLGNYVLLLIYNFTKNMHAFLDSRRNYAQGSDCRSCAIIYLDTIPEVLEIIHSEIEEIEVNEY
ncbi:MAG: hypothetical protein L0H53_00420 [Candidatus Nitrosocosmicus sp.]|nr:hypothetical protein [Candidatus Nitrosocosmicus sp.]